MADAGAGHLARFAALEGESLVGGGNRPVSLSDPESAWLVVRGAVDVFAARRAGDGPEWDFKHLLRAEPGRLIFATKDEIDSPDMISVVSSGEGRLVFAMDDEAGLGDTAVNVLVAKGLPGSELRRLRHDSLLGAGIDDLVAEQADAWITDVTAAVARDVPACSRQDLSLVTAGAETKIEAGGLVSARRGVVWVPAAAGGGMTLFGTEEVREEGWSHFPVTSESWLMAYGESRFTGLSSAEMMQRGTLLGAVADFQSTTLRALGLNRRLMLADIVNLRMARRQHRHESEEYARRNLLEVMDSRRSAAGQGGSALLAALRMVGDHEGIEFRAPPRRQGMPDRTHSLNEILDTTGTRLRRISLEHSDRWWRGDSGAFLAFRREDGAPVALIPGVWGRYRMVDPESGRSLRMTADRARMLEREACFFYRSLPGDRPIGGRELAGFAFRGVAGDFARFAVAGLLAGLFSLAPSIMLGYVVDHVLPSGSPRILAGMVAALVLVAMIVALLQTLQGTALMRLEGRATARVIAAIWDRMLRMPQSFFRRFMAGDLATRAMAFQILRDMVSGVVASAMLSVVFLVPTFALLFFYDVALGWLGLGLGLLALAFTLVMGLLQMPFHRRRYAVGRRLAGELLQWFNGMVTLRTAGAESAAYAIWARGYREQKQSELEAGRFQEHLVAFIAAVPAMATAALFALALDGSAQGFEIGPFLTIYAAFMVFIAAVAHLGSTFSAVAAIVPASEQAVPILRAVPDIGPEGEPLATLHGDIRLQRVTFAYGEDGPPVLREVSIHARPGEFVALVGESGSGKSTLFRLILGLERPQSGSVLFDGRNLDHLNVRTMRSRVGMVVQDASLRPGMVIDNIVGVASDLTLDDAWAAARLAAVDDDIKAMPMGMFTVAGENISSFSGGQVQRIMLAAALVRKPSLLLLDEATNWLDNESQARVMQGVEALSITRIVSAHRLSTIRNADRIYVLQDGRIAQQGTFDELMAESGVFRDLARRQMS